MRNVELSPLRMLILTTARCALLALIAKVCIMSHAYATHLNLTICLRADTNKKGKVIGTMTSTLSSNLEEAVRYLILDYIHILTSSDVPYYTADDKIADARLLLGRISNDEHI